MEDTTMPLDPEGLDAALDAPLPGRSGTMRQALQAATEEDARAAMAAAVAAYLTTASPDLADWLAHGERIIREDENVLRALAK